MKKPKSKTNPAKTPAVKPVEVKSEDWPPDAAGKTLAEIGRMSREESPMPTTEQISQLAALLAISEDGEPDELADAAIILWETVEQKLRQRKIEKKIRSMAEEYKHPSCPACLPVLRDDFLRLQLPHLKYRTGELASVAKAYAKSVIEKNLGNTREATPEEISDYYANWKPIETAFDYSMAAFNFFIWFRSYHSTRVSQSRRDAGLKSAQARSETKVAAGKSAVKRKRKTRPRREELREVKNTLLT
jgi:hypothetical protein